MRSVHIRAGVIILPALIRCSGLRPSHYTQSYGNMGKMIVTNKRRRYNRKRPYKRRKGLVSRSTKAVKNVVKREIKLWERKNVELKVNTKTLFSSTEHTLVTWPLATNITMDDDAHDMTGNDILIKGFGIAASVQHTGITDENYMAPVHFNMMIVKPKVLNHLMSEIFFKEENGTGPVPFAFVPASPTGDLERERRRLNTDLYDIKWKRKITVYPKFLNQINARNAPAFLTRKYYVKVPHRYIRNGYNPAGSIPENAINQHIFCYWISQPDTTVSAVESVCVADVELRTYYTDM